MNPFISFCLYVAARVFVQYLKSRPDDSQTVDSLRFLLSAMNALKRKNSLTESFLVQLDVDLEALGMRIPKLKSAFPRSGDSVSFAPSARCLNTDHELINPHQNSSMAARMKAQQLGPDVCEKRNGILAYKADLQFADGNQAAGPVGSNPNSGAQVSNGFDSTGANWLHGETQQIPSRERSTGPDPNTSGIVPQMMFHANNSPARVSPSGANYVESHSSGTNEMSVSPHPDGTSSNRPTPNSSSVSDQRSGPMAAGSGRTSFETSPIGSNQPLTTQAEMDAAAAAFFSTDPSLNVFGAQTTPGGGGTRTGMTPGRSPFVMPDGSGASSATNGYNLSDWGVLPGQTPTGTGMTPVAEGVLRHLMDMPPMDAMDLGWDQGT
jgi:hypothetical protein